MNEKEILERADSLGEAELDALPVGMIQLDREGRILKYNQTESEIARMKRADVLGKSFFDEVAPCTKVKEFHGRFVEGVQQRRLHATFPYEFHFSDGRRKDVLISMFYSQNTDTTWVLVERP